MIPVEQHPLQPFLPEGARVLMLGSFPPPKARWSMEFFYPNYINDMWRIVGLLFERDKHYFEVPDEKRFDVLKVKEFCASRGIALYDTATAVRRLQGNASDATLEVVEQTDIESLLRHLKECRTVVTTGEKATMTLCALFDCEQPALGDCVEVRLVDRQLSFWRMPSSSRAYPLALERKAEAYRRMFSAVGLL